MKMIGIVYFLWSCSRELFPCSRVATSEDGRNSLRSIIQQPGVVPVLQSCNLWSSTWTLQPVYYTRKGGSVHSQALWGYVVVWWDTLYIIWGFQVHLQLPILILIKLDLYLLFRTSVHYKSQNLLSGHRKAYGPFFTAKDCLTQSYFWQFSLPWVIFCFRGIQTWESS